MACVSWRIEIKEKGGGTLGVQAANDEKVDRYLKQGATKGAEFCDRVGRILCSDCKEENNNCPAFILFEKI